MKVLMCRILFNYCFSCRNLS